MRYTPIYKTAANPNCFKRRKYSELYPRGKQFKKKKNQAPTLFSQFFLTQGVAIPKLHRSLRMPSAVKSVGFGMAAPTQTKGAVTMSKMKELEAKLTEQQRKAAYMLVENDLKANKDETKLTYEQIAQEVGVTYKTIWSWKTQNRNFIAYKNEISDDFLSDKRSRVYGQLLKLIEGEQPSVKAIDLFMRRFGLLTEKTVVENVEGGNQRSADDIKRQLSELDDLLDDK